MGFLSSLSSLLLATVALGAPPREPRSIPGKASTPSIEPTRSSEGAQLDLDKKVIYRLRELIKEDPLGKLRKWNGLDVCKWEGISCGATDTGLQAVTGVDFGEFHFGGPGLTVAYFLDNLPFLTSLRLHYNKIHPPIPRDLSHLPYFIDLVLRGDGLPGPFPTGLLTAKKLILIDISHNQFSGPIPRELYSLNAENIYLQNNLFTGTIPSDLGHSNLVNLALSSNRLHGPIPVVNTMRRVKELSLDDNALTGTVPDFTGLLKLRWVDFSKNQLTGTIPASAAHLPSVEALNFTLNHLTGPLPQFSAPKLVYFEAAFNGLTGTVPESLCASPNLYGIDLRNNNLVGELGPACMKIANDKEKWIDIRGNCIKNMEAQKPGCGLPGKHDETNSARPGGLRPQSKNPS